MPSAAPAEQPEQDVPAVRGRAPPSRRQRLVHDADVRNALAPQARHHLRLGLLLEDAVEQDPLALDLDLEVVVFDGVRVEVHRLGLLRLQDAAQALLAPLRRRVIAARRLARLRHGFLDHGRQVLLFLLDLDLELLHGRPLGLEEVELLRVLALELGHVVLQLGDQPARRLVGQGIRARVAGLVVASLLGDAFRHGGGVVVVQGLELLERDVRARVGRDDVLLPAVGQQLAFLVVELGLELLGLPAQELGGLVHDSELGLEAPLDVGLRHRVRDLRGERGRRRDGR